MAIERIPEMRGQIEPKTASQSRIARAVHLNPLIRAFNQLVVGFEAIETSIQALQDEINEGGSTALFDSARFTTRSGIPIINAGGDTVQEFLEAYFFPSIFPDAALSVSGGSELEFGASNSVTLAWTATKNTNDITAIDVAGNNIVPTGETQSGNQAATATQNVNTTFNMLVTAAPGETDSASTTVFWRNRRYWGSFPTFTAPTDNEIRALDGASSGTGSALATSRIASYNGINGAGDYLMFAWPTSFGTPTFIVNNFTNNDFTKIRSNSNFTNQFGYTTPYDVWISNNPQNSPITSFQVQ